MTSVKKNDFAEGFITSGTGYLMTVKNLTNKHTVKLDGDSVAVQAFGKLENQQISLIWDKTNTRFAVQEGQGEFFEITLKSFEDIPPTYIKKPFVKKDEVLDMFAEYGISPSWTKYDVTSQQYQKVQ
tara:strand:+ start:100 stop:480 length:381 start_codon:yes stop_codon:yes gene_type:complete